VNVGVSQGGFVIAEVAHSVVQPGLSLSFIGKLYVDGRVSGMCRLTSL
jgi:hypothetical protein